MFSCSPIASNESNPNTSPGRSFSDTPKNGPTFHFVWSEDTEGQIRARSLSLSLQAFGPVQFHSPFSKRRSWGFDFAQAVGRARSSWRWNWTSSAPSSDQLQRAEPAPLVRQAELVPPSASPGPLGRPSAAWRARSESLARAKLVG